MLKPLAVAVLLATGQPAIAATTWSYDFSGNFDDHFSQMSDVGTAVAIQSGGRFIYSADSLDTSGDGPILVHQHFMPTFGQSWTTQIDATIPLSLDSLPNVKDWYMEVGLAVGYMTANSSHDLSLSHHLSYGLEIGNMADLNGTHPARKYLGENYVDEQDIWDDAPYPGDPTSQTSLETVTLQVSFDNQSKILTASSTQFGQFVTVDTSNWGMKNADPFLVAPFFSAEGYGVPANAPLAIDNFSATLNADPSGTVVPNFLGGNNPGNLFVEYGVHDSNGILQLVSEGAFGLPTFMTPGTQLQLFDVSVNGVLDAPVELSFVYDPALLPNGFDEANLRVFHWTGTEWENLGGVVDAANNTITVTTNSLSPFAIAAVPEPETYALMLAGLGLVGFAARRRKSA